MLQQSKYAMKFADEAIEKNIKRLTNQIWKLIPMRENEENWRKQLETVTIEIAGLINIFNQDPHLLQLLSILEGLNVVDISFSTYRRMVFETIDLLQRCIKNE